MFSPDDVRARRDAPISVPLSSSSVIYRPPSISPNQLDALSSSRVIPLTRYSNSEPLPGLLRPYVSGTDYASRNVITSKYRQANGAATTSASLSNTALSGNRGITNNNKPNDNNNDKNNSNDNIARTTENSRIDLANQGAQATKARTPGTSATQHSLRANDRDNGNGGSNSRNPYRSSTNSQTYQTTRRNTGASASNNGNDNTSDRIAQNSYNENTSNAAGLDSANSGVTTASAAANSNPNATTNTNANAVTPAAAAATSNAANSIGMITGSTDNDAGTSDNDNGSTAMLLSAADTQPIQYAPDPIQFTAFVITAVVLVAVCIFVAFLAIRNVQLLYARKYYASIPRVAYDAFGSAFPRKNPLSFIGL